MPKEMIFGYERPYTDVSSAQSVIEVHWSRDHFVQVAARGFNDDLKYLTDDGVTHVAEGAEAERRKQWEQGYFVSLDRAAINKLIRDLRRARDQAFGKDE